MQLASAALRLQGQSAGLGASGRDPAPARPGRGIGLQQAIVVQGAIGVVGPWGGSVRAGAALARSSRSVTLREEAPLQIQCSNQGQLLTGWRHHGTGGG